MSKAINFELDAEPAALGPVPVAVPLPSQPDHPLHATGTARRKILLSRLRPGLLLAGLFLLLLIIAALGPSLLTGGDPLAAQDAFLSPSAAHPLGTDENGRDILVRLIYGARPSLILGLFATMVAVLGGAGLGLLAGLGSRWIDALVARFLDMMMAVPDMLLALLIITFWGQSTLNEIVAIGVAAVPRYARLVRARAQVVRRSGYVEAAATQGQHPLLIVARHIFPNALKPVMVLATIGIGTNIAAGAGLSFLGFGSPPPAPEWGAMLATGRDYLANAWWLVAAPGLLVTLTVLSITAIGRALVRRSEGQPA